MKVYDIGSRRRVRLAVGHQTLDDRVVVVLIDHLDSSGSSHLMCLVLSQSDSRYHSFNGVPIPLWDVEEPAPPKVWFLNHGIDGVTLAQPVLCKCGEQGWIRNGRWEQA